MASGFVVGGPHPVCTLFTVHHPALLKCYPSAVAKRQAGGVGSAFDGTFGVDSQDILSIPEIGFGSFQLFPDQNSYGTVPMQFTPPSSDFAGTVQQGTAWIQAQAASALA